MHMSRNQRHQSGAYHEERTIYSALGWNSSSAHMAAYASIEAVVQPVSFQSQHQCAGRSMHAAPRTEGSSVPASSAESDASFHTPPLHTPAPALPGAPAAAAKRRGVMSTGRDSLTAPRTRRSSCSRRRWYVRIEARDPHSLCASAQPQLRSHHKRSECARCTPSAALHLHRASRAVLRWHGRCNGERQQLDRLRRQATRPRHVLWRTSAPARRKAQPAVGPHGTTWRSARIAEECA